MKTMRFLPFLLFGILVLAGCSKGYELGDFYSNGDLKGIVVAADADSQPSLILSLDEVTGLDADSAAQWAASLYDGSWRLPTKDEIEVVKKYKYLINKTLQRKKMPPVMMGHSFYWTSSPCSESHTYASGPDGTRCYFNSNASPHYCVRAVKEIAQQQQ